MIRAPYKPSWPFTINRGSKQSLGLVIWWPGAPPGASTTFDSSGRGNHGGLTAFASPFTTASGYATGVNGGRGAFIFDGTDDRVELPAAKSAIFTYFLAAQAYTVSCWIKIVAQPSNTHGWIAGVRVGSVGNGWYIYWEKAGSRFLHGYQGLNGLHHYRYSSALSLSTTYHVAFTRDTTNTIGGTQVYVNGVLDAGSTDSTGTPDDFLVIGTPLFCIGNDSQNTSFPSSCVMEDLRVYNRAISASDVWQLYDPKTRWQDRWQTSLTSRIFRAPGNVSQYGRRAKPLSGGFIDMDL